MSARASIRRFISLFGWTRHSYYILSGFLLVCGLIIYAWWPLAKDVLASLDWHGPWWLTFDWLLVGIWLAMSLLIMAKANLRTDARIVFVGLVGGLVIESWGTQTNLWFYYTAERPPLWIIPAWPIAALATDRLMRLLHYCLAFIADKGFRDLGNRTGFLPSISPNRVEHLIYGFIFGGFSILMLFFVAPTFDKSLTIMAILLCALLILSPTDTRMATLTFLAGAGLGYFLELWGTTRQCWTYYTYQTPPLFAVLAHGMASVAFWRVNLLLGKIIRKVKVGYEGIRERG
jgi:hypothetical protein